MSSTIKILLLSMILSFSSAQAKTDASSESLTVARLNCKNPKDLVEMARCLEEGRILKVRVSKNIQWQPHLKWQVGKIAHCDSKAGDASFNKCLSKFFEKNPRAALAGANCWQIVDEEQFKKCAGWRKKPLQMSDQSLDSGKKTEAGSALR